jgi:RNA polymerase sigma-70 factor (ECF subfamily)
MSRVSDDHPTPEQTEMASLVRLAIGGDVAAFEGVIRRYERRVISIAAKLLGGVDDAQDAAQEVFFRAFRYLHRLDPNKPIEPWLVRMTVNVCRDIGRKRGRWRHTVPLVAAPEAAIAATGDPHTGLTGEQEKQMVRRALESLPEKERLAILLRDVEGYATAEVAEILRSSETTVRSQISRGRLKMKQTLDRIIGGRQ